MADIFISYRRETGEFLARCLYDELSKNGYNVFYDIESLNAGVFDEQIYQRIQESSDFLLLLTKDSLNRCKNDGDWVRQEVKYALKLNKNIIPIFTRGFEFPELPETMKDLPRFQGVEATSGDMEIVIKRLQGYMSAKPRNNGTNNIFSTLSVPAINPTFLDFIQIGGAIEDLLLFEGNYSITDYWREFLDLSALFSECEEERDLTETKYNIHKKQESLFKTLSTLYYMEIIGSAPINKSDFWYDTIGNNEVINLAAMHELLVSAHTYLSFKANFNHETYSYKYCVRSRIRNAFTYMGQCFQLLDEIEYSLQRYIVAIHNTDELLPEHVVFQVNPDSSLVKLEWNMQICREVFGTYAVMYRMVSLLPPGHFGKSKLSYGKVSSYEIPDSLKEIPYHSFSGYWKPKGIFKKKIFILVKPNIYITTENGKETVLDVVEVTQQFPSIIDSDNLIDNDYHVINVTNPNSLRSREADYYVLSVPITKTNKWLDEPHIWSIAGYNLLDDYKRRDPVYELIMKRVEKASALLTEEILERFAIIMQVYRQSGLFMD